MPKTEKLNKLKNFLDLTSGESLDKMKQLLTWVDDDILTRKEMTDGFKQMIDFLKKLKASNQGEFKNLNQNISDQAERLKGDNLSDLELTKSQLNEFNAKLSKVIEDKITSVRDGVDGKDADEDRVSIMASERALEAVTPLIPTTRGIKKEILTMGRTLRKALKRKLRIKDIKNLRKELDELKQGKGIISGGGGNAGGHVMKVYDISDSLDGSTKTFSLPSFWRVISVHSSSFPNAFRPTTDYTTDASAMTIAFTSEINAATTLATGQTIIITYSE